MFWAVAAPYVLQVHSLNVSRFSHIKKLWLFFSTAAEPPKNRHIPLGIPLEASTHLCFLYNHMPSYMLADFLLLHPPVVERIIVLAAVMEKAR